MAKNGIRFIRTNRNKAISSALKDMSKYDSATQEKIKLSVRDVTEAVAAEAKKRVHDVTGNLKRSINTSFSEKENSGYVKAVSPHAHLVEFGAKATMMEPNPKNGKKALKIDKRFAAHALIPKRKANPFLKPAAEQEKPKLEQKIREVLK